jgi:outer membrane protein assembly factor BamB
MTVPTAMLTLLGVLAGQYLPDSRDFVSNQALRDVGLQRYWAGDLPVPQGEDAVSAALVDDSLYVWTERSTVIAMHAPTGLPLWARNLNEGRYHLLRPTHLWTPQGPGPVAVVSARNAYILDRLSGQPIASYRLPFAYGTPAVGDGEMMYMGGADGHMHALRWDTARVGLGAVPIWEVWTAGPIRSRPAFDGANLFFASGGGEVVSCIADGKIRNWTATVEGAVVAALAYHDSGVYVASTGRLVYRFDRQTGRKLWQCRLPTPLEVDPIVIGANLYQSAGGAGLYAVDVDSGEVAWQQPEAELFVARKADRVAALAVDGEHLLILDNSTGKVVHSLDVFGAKIVVSNPYDDAVYVVTKTNQAFCFRPADVPYLTMDAIAEARARLTAHADESEGQE